MNATTTIFCANGDVTSARPAGRSHNKQDILFLVSHSNNINTDITLYLNHAFTSTLD